MKARTGQGKLLLMTGLIGISLPLSATASGEESLTSSAVIPATTQQNRTITGKVFDKMGEPIIGANVLVKGTTNGTITDIDGNFKLEDVPEGAILQISYIGFKNMEIPAKANLSVKLQEDTETLDEVIVVGYTAQRKESLTGSLQTVKESKLKDVTTANVENMLNGKVSGVFVAPGSGQPGSGGAVVVRGKTSINGSNKPLWVVDGVIVGDGVGQLNPADIETMTILKDAASTAIYGSQGANGVIVVTTKNGKTGKMTVNASAKVGFSRLNNGNLEMMDGAELYDYYKSFQNADVISFPRWNEDLRNANFDWWKLATQTGLNQEYNVSLSGGSEKINSYFSLGYYDEEGAVKGYDLQRYNFRYRSNYKPFSWLTIKPSVSGAMRTVTDAQYSVGAMYSMLPWDSPYDEEGNLVPDRYQGWVNNTPTNYLNDLAYGNHTDYKTYEFSGNFDFDIRITDWLTFSSVNNFRYTSYYYHAYSDPRTDGASGVKGRLEEYQSNTVYRYTNQLLRFNKTWGDHSLNGVLAYEFNDYQAKAVKAIGTGFVPGFEVLDVTALPEKVGGSLNEWAVQSYLFNANYAYDNRYLAQVSFRRDGASNFGDDHKYGSFFSVSAGWNINREKWFKADWVDNLKLRASYGTVGNRPTDLYPQYDLYSVSSNYDGIPGALINQIGNDGLTWEKTYTTGVGLDGSFFGDRLRFVFDYYYKYTSNILFQVPVSGLTGVTSRWLNIGEMANQGIELTIGGDIIRTKDWTWSLEANLGHNKNKIKKLYGNNTEIVKGAGLGIAGEAEIILKEGYDSNSFYLREWAGVNPENGAPQWYKSVKDESGNVIGREVTEDYAKADRVICPSSSPKIFGGFNTSVRWKNIDLSAVFGYSVGGKIYNYSRLEYDSDGAYTDRNQMKLQDGWSRWQKPGDIATHPAAYYGNKNNSNSASTRYLEDSDFLKLRTLTLGYNLSLPKYYIQNMRIFFTGENLFTLTGYSGVDPEIPASNGSVLGSTGPSVYPSVRKFMFGINLTF